MRLINIFCLIFTIATFSQEQISNLGTIEEIKYNIVEQSKWIETIQSDFIQLKHLSFMSNDIETKGKLFYKASQTIRWDYTEPYNYSIIIKGGTLYLNDAGSKSNLSLESNAALENLGTLIVKSVKGDLVNDKDFDITYYELPDAYRLVFKSREGDLKEFVQQFEITFSKSDYNVKSVKMLEDTGDYTLLKFTNQKFNQDLSDEVFIH